LISEKKGKREDHLRLQKGKWARLSEEKKGTRPQKEKGVTPCFFGGKTRPVFHVRGGEKKVEKKRPVIYDDQEGKGGRGGKTLLQEMNAT